MLGSSRSTAPHSTWQRGGRERNAAAVTSGARPAEASCVREASRGLTRLEGPDEPAEAG